MYQQLPTNEEIKDKISKILEESYDTYYVGGGEDGERAEIRFIAGDAEERITAYILALLGRDNIGV